MFRTGLNASDVTAAPAPLAAVLAVGNSAANSKITNLGAPTAAADAATKAYVDAAVGGGPPTGLTAVLLANPSASGQQITNLGAPTLGSNAATKSYVDTSIAGIPAPATPALSAVLAAGNSAGAKITNLTDPTLAQDAATKTYVDTAAATAAAAVPIPTLAAVIAQGNIAGNKITGLSPPTGNNDAATKFYVDDVTNTLTNNFVPRWSTGTSELVNTNIAADPVNSRVGVGTTTPGTLLHLRGTGTAQLTLDDTSTSDTLATGRLDVGAASHVTTVGGANRILHNAAGTVIFGQLDVNSQRIISLAPPASGVDAANKNYVDQWQPAITSTSATITATTTSTVDVAVVGMSITPAAGTYNVHFNTVVSNSANNQSITVTLYTDAAALASSAVTATTAAGNQSIPLSCLAEMTVNGVQAINVRWRTGGNTAAMTARWLTIIRMR